MKKKSSVSAIIVPSLIILLLASCQKESIYTNTGEEEATSAASQGPVTRAYRDSFDADLHFVPDIAGGWTYPNSAPAWFHGNGHGNATHMGNVNTYFNTYTLKSSAGVMVYGRSVTMFYATQLQSYDVPSNVSGIVYDDKGNSIWFRIAPEGWTSWHTDATHVAMTGTSFIVGGTGKFTGATGETTTNATFNQLILQECSLWQNGWIAY